MANFLVAIIILSALLALHSQTHQADAFRNFLGVCYGTVANNLPPPADVVNLYKQNQIGSVRLFEPNPDILNALRGSQIEVTVGIRNQDLPALAASNDAVEAWLATNVLPYVNDVNFLYIAAGNEVITGPLAQYVLPVIQSLQRALHAHGLHGVRATVVVHGVTLANGYPPSATVFSADAAPLMTDIVKILSQNGSPLLVNVYPYFAYTPGTDLDFALFKSTNCVIQDGNLCYTNLFTAMVDGYIWAMEKVGITDVDLVVSESGWPSAGNGDITTPAIAQAYNHNFMNHITSTAGSPKRPGQPMEGFIFAMFNENLKSPGPEQNFGLFYPNMQPVYDIFS